MGDRAQIGIKQDNGDVIYLYAHWDGAGVYTILRKVLARKQRWDQPDYLARMIFSAMIKRDIDGETGYGISTSIAGDVENTVPVLDCKKKLIYWIGPRTTNFLPNTFDEFIL